MDTNTYATIHAGVGMRIDQAEFDGGDTGETLRSNPARIGAHVIAIR